MNESNEAKIKSFTIFISPPAEIAERIMEINEVLRPYWDEEYILSSAHLTLYYSAIPEGNVSKLKEAVSEYADSMEKAEVKLGKIISAEDNYFMIEILSAPLLEKINRELVALIRNLREGIIMKKYSENWETYSEDKKKIILATGHQYAYHPHLTLAKVRSETLAEAEKALKSLSFKGLSFIPESLGLSIIDDGAADRTSGERISFKLKGH